MAYSTVDGVTTLFCNRGGCEEIIQTSMSLGGTRRYADLYGWVKYTLWQLDYCPKHWSPRASE
jgi:hypothetical protein